MRVSFGVCGTYYAYPVSERKRIMEHNTNMLDTNTDRYPPEIQLATELYKNINMGSEASLHLLPKVKNNELKTLMTAAMCYYEKAAGKAEKFIKEHGDKPEEESMMTRMASRAGIAMNTMMDDSTSHIAQMIVKGSTMGVTEATKLLHRYEGRDGCGEMLDLAREWVEFEEAHIEKVKAFL